MRDNEIILQAEYVKDFVCNGLICEDSCCQGGWETYVDKKYYKKIKKVTNPKLKSKIDRYIKKNKDKSNQDFYATIHHDKDLNQCIFLAADKLCEIQNSLGADYLCDVCMTFPRIISLVDGRYERTLTMACPLAAEKALLNPEPMAFEQFDIIPERDITINAGIFDTEGDSSLVQAEKYFWDLRFFSIGILQDRNYSLDDRLIILGIIYQNIEKLFDNDKHDELPTTLEQMAILIDSDFFRNQLRKFTPNISIQIQMIEAMVYEKVLQGLPSHRYMECLEEILTEFGYQEEAGLDEIIAKCEENYRTYYRPYIMEKEYILENFLVNEFFKERMPFGQYKTIWDSYIYLCVLYSMIKLHLIGLAGYHQGLNDDLTLKLIQSLSKVVVHNVEYIQSVIDVIKENDYDSLAYMSKLIKN